MRVRAAGTIRQPSELYEVVRSLFGDEVQRKLVKHKCPHCGANYEVGVFRASHPTYHNAVCSYCGDVMAEWHGPARHYRRVSRPRTSATFAKAIVEIAAGAARREKKITSRAKHKRNGDNRKASA